MTVSAVGVPLLRPFAALRPTAAHAAAVVAPPYDVLDADEARIRAAGKPWSFLHISKAEIDLPPGTDPYAPAVYARAAANLRHLLDQQVLIREPQPAYYVYRLSAGDHRQTGIVGAASVAAYDAGRIRRHEFTRPDKEDDRVRQIEAVGAHTGPVLAAFRPVPVLTAILERVIATPPEFDVTADDGVAHALWVVTDAADIARITDAFAAMDAVWIADGHHRSAAASRVAASRRAAGAVPADGTGESFLLVSFPTSEMIILDYNRVVRDLGGLSPADFLARVRSAFTVDASGAPVRPVRAGEIGLYLGGSGWHRLTVIDPPAADTDPVARLDVSLLTDRILTPILGIADLRKDKRIDFVGGARGLAELERRVNSGEMAAAFVLHPTSMDDLIAVTAAGKVMPPKSTWFEPKLADGVTSLPLD